MDFNEKTVRQAADNVRKHQSTGVAQETGGQGTGVASQEKPYVLSALSLKKLQETAGEGKEVVSKEELYVFRALSLKKMQETAELLRFYQTLGKEVDADSIKYNITKETSQNSGRLSSRERMQKRLMCPRLQRQCQ